MDDELAWSDDAVYSSVPEKLISKGGDSLRIVKLLKEYAPKSFTAVEIARYAGYPVRGSCVEVRKAITILLEKGYPLVSGAAGFKYAQRKEDLTDYLLSLENRRKGLDRRIRGVERAIGRFD